MSVHTTSTEARRDRRRNQVETGKHARRFEQPWTPADDTELLTGPGTIAARAVRLGRTYYACSQRLYKLRQLGAARRAEAAKDVAA